MTKGDIAFTGSVPDFYDRYTGPMLFEPHALDTARRFDGYEGDALEVAAGTGRLTQALVARLGSRATLTATDLNVAMLDIARRKIDDPRVRFREADAQALAFGDAEFGLVLCQFGMMYFPDKAEAMSEMRRVLRPAGTLVFNVWEDLDANDFCRVMTVAIERDFPQDPPGFFKRGPFSFHDRDEIAQLLAAQGFVEIAFERVVLATSAASAAEAAVGLCRGSPLAGEVGARDPERLPRVVETAERALREAFGEGPITGWGQALLVTARAP